MIEDKHHHLIAKEGYPFIAISLIFALVGFYANWILGLGLVGLFIFVVSFFRNPKRVIPYSDDHVICPADGKVIGVSQIEEKNYLGRKVKRICIFMSPLNVHVNRIPMTGTIKKAEHKSGKFFAAFEEKAAMENEQNVIVLENAHQEEIMFIQISGWLARRIISYAKPGDVWKQGAMYGLIRFGSRVDVYIPENYNVLVKDGDIVRCGSTILAKR